MSITIVNNKGEVGKTTTAVYLAHALQAQNKCVLCVEMGCTETTATKKTRRRSGTHL